MPWSPPSKPLFSPGENPHKKQATDEELANLAKNERQDTSFEDIVGIHKLEKTRSQILNEVFANDKAKIAAYEAFAKSLGKDELSKVYLKVFVRDEVLTLQEYVDDLIFEHDEHTITALEFKTLITELLSAPSSLNFGTGFQDDKVGIFIEPQPVTELKLTLENHDFVIALAPDFLVHQKDNFFVSTDEINPADLRKKMIQAGFTENNEIC